MPHLKRHSSGHLSLHSSGHLALKRTQIATPTPFGVYLGGGSWGDTVVEAANGAVSDLTLDVVADNVLGTAGVRWRAFASGGRYYGYCQYEGKYWELPVDSALLSCTLRKQEPGRFI